MHYANFGIILVSENYGKQNPDYSYADKYLNHVFWVRFGYKLGRADNQFSKPFRSGQDAAHEFITNMVEESKYCSHVIKNNLNKELAITKEDKECLKLKKMLAFDNIFVEEYVKVRDHCHITRKYRDIEGRDCNINGSLN